MNSILDKVTKEEREQILSIKVPAYFGQNYSYDEPDEEFLMELTPAFKKIGYHEFAWGCTKFVAISNRNDNYIIKIPFEGYYEHNYKTDEDDYTEFSMGDYCAIEENIYAEIENEDFAVLFAETASLGNGFYVQERAESCFNYCDETRSSSKDSLKKAEEWEKEYITGGFATEWVAIAIDFYGEEVVEHFLTYARQNIHDIHTGNYGYRFDGSPVIFDYSGYSED